MPRGEGWSLRRRILLWSGAILTVGILVAGLVFVAALDRVLYRAALDGAQTIADQVASGITSGELTPGGAAAKDPARAVRIQILDDAGRVVADSTAAGEAAAISKAAPRPGEFVSRQEVGVAGRPDEPYAVAARGVRDPAGSAYVVVVASPLAVEASTTRAAALLLALGSVVLLLGLLLLIWRIVDRALEPVEQIRSDVAAIQRLGVNERVVVPASGDEIARLAQTMNDLLARLEGKESTMRRFISDASHELRSPLTSIRAVLETFEHTGESQNERDRVLLDEVVRMQRLVDNLLTLAKADDNGLVMARQDVDLDDLLDQEARRIRASSKVPVLTEIEPARVVGDQGRLAQLLRNLTDNALRHTTDGIYLGVGIRGAQAILTVDNDGPPIAEADREAVFERFTRLQASRERDSGGSGLGLAIVRTIARAHGGEAVATHDPHGRCRFEVRFPAP
ncbi:sensor histidine kinase [Gephyromycinifex aptenodytis]|uniref:sensor histidine kinase n=1 Tax=Gephyromycinifex aptenodytis TaxID=2716227 RepID=UPI001446DCBF|nr:HAMP domain-containing sensor histidine kinase [Gephyromycinifex aptenodytis]